MLWYIKIKEGCIASSITNKSVARTPSLHYTHLLLIIMQISVSDEKMALGSKT